MLPDPDPISWQPFAVQGLIVEGEPFVAMAVPDADAWLANYAEIWRFICQSVYRNAWYRWDATGEGDEPVETCARPDPQTLLGPVR